MILLALNLYFGAYLVLVREEGEVSDEGEFQQFDDESLRIRGDNILVCHPFDSEDCSTSTDTGYSASSLEQ